MRILSEHGCFGGVQGYYAHDSAECAGEMRFSVFVPPRARGASCPVVFYLAGLTCTEETFAIKAGAQRVAAELGLALVAPDTSPRNTGIAGEADDWELGAGAGFYVDAVEAPWAGRFRMYSWVTGELPALVAKHFPVDPERQAIFGHSMGGHGALVCALRQPARYRSVSAFAPIAAPTRCPWGEKAFTAYLGADRARWSEWDAAELIARAPRRGDTILVDQGLADKFLAPQLGIDRLEQVCAAAGQPLALRRHAGYDHGYFFIATFVEDHLRHHAAALGVPGA